jgi:glycosyltransferase involved in cell wall biosynthesis
MNNRAREDKIWYNTRVKIGINASFLRKPGTGIGQVTWHFLNTLKDLPEAQNHEFFIYMEDCCPEGEWPQNFHLRKLSHLWPRDDEFRKYLFETIAIPRALHYDECEVFFSLYQSATVISDIPQMVLVHDIIPEIFPEYRSTFRKQCFWEQVVKGLRSATFYGAVSKHTKEDMYKHLNIAREKVQVYTPSVDPIFESEVCLPDKAKLMMKYNLPENFIYHGGGLEIRKNTELVLRAYKVLTHLLPHNKLPKLVISGTLYSEKNPLATPVKKLIAELELEDKVTLLGHVPLADLPVLYALASVFVYPSRYEGFGLPVLEALKVGTPVITTRIASIPEVGGEAVLYTHPDDKEALARLMKKVVTEDTAVRHEQTLAGKRVAKQFEWKSFTSQILETLTKI